MKTKWSILEKKSKLSPFDIPIDYNILNILNNRGISKKEDIIAFVNPKLENLQNPLYLKDLDLATSYIQDAIKNNLKICIFGDYDVDGITSTSLLYLSLKKLGAQNLCFYIPLRNEGYGLNKNAISELKKDNVDLIITVDCGINSIDEVQYLNSLGMKCIITDHHDISNTTLPKALACINPKRVDNKYDFKYLAGVGVAFLLAYQLFKEANILEEVYEYLDLVSLGTISDVMPLVKENRILVKFGLLKLQNSSNLGLKNILEKLQLENKELTTGDVSFKIAPIFNAAGRLSDAKLVVKLLCSDNIYEIKMITDNLISNNIDRKVMQDKITNKVLKDIEKENTENTYILISSSAEYHHGVIGIVAAKILETYYLPCIIMEEKPEENIAVGSCRSIENFNITKALSSVSHLLEKFGGHANAAGFTIKLENIPQFKKEINKYAYECLHNSEIVKNINIDMRIPAQKISYEFIQSLNLLKPFGFGNPTPLLISKNCMIYNMSTVGDNKHLKFDIDQKGFSVKNAIWFNKADKLNELKKSNIFYDIVFKLEINEYKDKFYPSILIEDMKTSDLNDDRFLFYHSMFYTSFPIKSVFYTNFDINEDDKIHISRNFSNYSIKIGSKTVSKLDNNISTLLAQLEDFYNYKYTCKIEKIEQRENHKIVYIIIKKNYLLNNYSTDDKVQFRNIKNFLLPSLQYNDFTKKVLSMYFKENKSIHISKENINISGYTINDSFFFNLLLTIGMKFYFKYNKKMNFYTTNHVFTENAALKTYFNFLSKTKVTNVDEECIYDFYTINKAGYKLNFKKSIIFSKEDLNDDRFTVLKYDLQLPKNILKFNSNLLKNIDYENIFLEFLPISKKLSLLENIKKDKIVYSDDSIIHYY